MRILGVRVVGYADRSESTELFTTTTTTTAIGLLPGGSSTTLVQTKIKIHKTTITTQKLQNIKNKTIKISTQTEHSKTYETEHYKTLQNITKLNLVFPTHIHVVEYKHKDSLILYKESSHDHCRFHVEDFRQCSKTCECCVVNCSVQNFE